MSMRPSGNHESLKSKIQKRKKARSNAPLSCKIKYYINATFSYFSGRSVFFTDDYARPSPSAIGMLVINVLLPVIRGPAFAPSPQTEALSGGPPRIRDAVTNSATTEL